MVQLQWENANFQKNAKFTSKHNFGPGSQYPMFERTYVGNFYKKTKNSITPHVGARGPRKPPKTAFFEL